MMTSQSLHLDRGTLCLQGVPETDARLGGHVKFLTKAGPCVVGARQEPTFYYYYFLYLGSVFSGDLDLFGFGLQKLETI